MAKAFSIQDPMTGSPENILRAIPKRSIPDSHYIILPNRHSTQATLATPHKHAYEITTSSEPQSMIVAGVARSGV